MIFFGKNYYGGIGHEGAKARRNTKDWCGGMSTNSRIANVFWGGIGHEFTNVRVILGRDCYLFDIITYLDLLQKNSTAH